MSFGWIFTEIGRQPFLVNGMMSTEAGVSSSVGAWSVALTMILFTLLYGALAVAEIKLTLRYAQRGAIPVADPADPATRDADAPLLFAY
jgi:cytochrome d ubiquinol oxidase subunit I